MAKFFAVFEKIVLPFVGVVIAFFSFQLNERVSEFDQQMEAQNRTLKNIQEQRNLHWDIINKLLDVGKCDDTRKLQILQVVLEELPDTSMQQTFLPAVQRVSLVCKKAQSNEDVSSEEAQRRSEIYQDVSDSVSEKLFSLDTQQIASRANVERTTKGKWGNWDFDLFYCEGYSAGERQAKTIQENLNLEGAEGRVRVRKLLASVNKRPGYQVSGNQIRYNDNTDEKKIAEGLKQLSTRLYPLEPITLKKSAQETNWYVSAFFCPNTSN